MCGIAGIYVFNGEAEHYRSGLQKAVLQLSKRGPDAQGMYFDYKVGLAHARLSIIDVSNAGAQPMTDISGRYTIIFNGEIYNYQDLKQGLLDQGVAFTSESDTEVLLNLYIREGAACLGKLNGFFAFSIYDKEEESLFVARDRIGIKPLLYIHNDKHVIFGSEMKAIMAFPMDKTIDMASLAVYLQLNYIPAPATIFKHVKKLLPGEYLHISRNGVVQKEKYYSIPYERSQAEKEISSYEAEQKTLVGLLDGAVKRRLVADVPLGAFLSGGIDSSVIVALASRHKKLDTFSIGFADEPYFDETSYAELVAKKFDTNHTVFSLTNNDLYEHLFDILEYIDEPFADSSAIPVYILSKHTRQRATVALSGDGADELLGGYNKHWAEYKVRQGGLVNNLLKWNQPLLGLLPQSRSSKVGNLFRQMNRFAEGAKMSEQERYWRWCSFISQEQALNMLNDKPDLDQLEALKERFTHFISTGGTINDNLYADMHLVLQNDMLTKVDLMSMANSLEVRVPFLDHTVVEYLFTLPASYKVRNGFRKSILKDAFRTVLPAELYDRPKQGFEVPLLGWFKNELKTLIQDDLLADDLIEEQGIFDVEEIRELKQRLYSNNPGEVHAQIWGLVVFQYWWKKYLA